MSKKSLVTTSTSWVRMLILKSLARPEITPYHTMNFCSAVIGKFVMADIYLLCQFLERKDLSTAYTHIPTILISPLCKSVCYVHPYQEVRGHSMFFVTIRHYIVPFMSMEICIGRLLFGQYITINLSTLEVTTALSTSFPTQ